MCPIIQVVDPYPVKCNGLKYLLKAVLKFLGHNPIRVYLSILATQIPGPNALLIPYGKMLTKRDKAKLSLTKPLPCSAKHNRIDKLK